ncbi:hypothetical protein HYW82_04295 [Candidatus Peregrinibacteria bacterium]|nr:hypothetical protein [Candidatus Peregrinibacteria bacterium]
MDNTQIKHSGGRTDNAQQSQQSGGQVDNAQHGQQVGGQVDNAQHGQQVGGPNGQTDNAVVFYCKDCEEVVATHRVGRKFVYKCAKCGTKNVAFGTKKSIFGFFKLEETKKEEAAAEKSG